MGRPDQITSTPTQLCMEEFFPPTTTRNDVGHCYHSHVTPQAPETVSMGVFQMSPPTEHKLPYWSPMETYIGAISGTQNGKLCLSLPSIITFIPPIQLGIWISSFQCINDGIQILHDWSGFMWKYNGHDYKTHSMLATSGSWFKNIW